MCVRSGGCDAGMVGGAWSGMVVGACVVLDHIVCGMCVWCKWCRKAWWRGVGWLGGDCTTVRVVCVPHGMVCMSC